MLIAYKNAKEYTNLRIFYGYNKLPVELEILKEDSFIASSVFGVLANVAEWEMLTNVFVFVMWSSLPCYFVFGMLRRICLGTLYHLTVNERSYCV